MSSPIRPLVRALALVFASSLALAESVPPASEQIVSAPVAAQQSPAVPVEQQASPPPVESNDVAQSDAGSVADDTGALAGEVKSPSSESDAGPDRSTAVNTEAGPIKSLFANTDAFTQEAPSSAGDMPSHAPLRAHAEGAELRRRVPLFMFRDVQGMVRFTEAEPAINEKARSLAGRATASFWIGNGSAVLTGGLLGFSLAAPDCDSQLGGLRCRPNLAMLLSALGTFVVGQVVAYVVAPKEPDFVELIEAWNATVDEAIVPDSAVDPRGTDTPVQQAP